MKTFGRFWSRRPVGLAMLRAAGLALLVVSLTGCPRAETSPHEALLEAARDAGVEVHAEEVYTLSRGEESVVAAPIAGWETIPATQLAEGVPFAFAYLSAREAGVPEGYYTLRAFADATSVGTVEARVELVDEEGEVAGQLPAVAEIHALSVPEHPPFERSFITSRPGDSGQTVLWFRCPNGVCIRTPILSRRPIGFPAMDVEGDPRRALEQASATANVQIDSAQTLSVFRPGSAVAAAPLVSWADVPATQLANGVDFAFAYLASDELDVPPGYYTLRAVAEPTGPGLVPARVALLDHRGESVRQLEAEVMVHSMTVPEQRQFPGSIVTTVPGAEHLTLWFQCSNGQCVRLLLR
jgi:hypothetical protein